MPVYEQILPQYIPQTTTTITDETERSTQPALDASTPTCGNHQPNHPPKLENCCVNNFTGFNDSIEGAKAVSPSMTQIKQDADHEAFDTDASD